MIASPNPTRRTRLLDASMVSDHRSLFCREYDDCLEIAATGGWTSWSCEHCPLAATRSASLVPFRREAPAAPDAAPSASVAAPEPQVLSP